MPKSFYHFHRKSPRIKVPPPTFDLNFHIKKISMFWEIFSRKQRVGTNRSRKSRHIPRWFVRVWNIKCETSVSIHRNLKEKIMKFAEHLTAHITPEWRKQYINYEVRFQIFSNNAKKTIRNCEKSLCCVSSESECENFYMDIDTKYWKEYKINYDVTVVEEHMWK